ncbi:MAG: ion transporter [Bacteroidales bacterium]|nr:ion transporter [Bacteroidales bacterium]
MLLLIFLSIIILSLESAQKIKLHHGYILSRTEWVITILFTLEYILRIVISKKPWRYINSFWGIIHLLSILTTNVAFFFYRNTLFYYYLFIAFNKSI